MFRNRARTHRPVRLHNYEGVGQMPAVTQAARTKLDNMSLEQAQRNLLRKMAPTVLDEIVNFVSEQITGTENEYLPSGVPHLDGVVSVVHRMCFYHTYVEQENLLPGIGHTCLQRLFILLVPLISQWASKYVQTATIQERRTFGQRYLPVPFDAVCMHDNTTHSSSKDLQSERRLLF